MNKVDCPFIAKGQLEKEVEKNSQYLINKMTFPRNTLTWIITGIFCFIALITSYASSSMSKLESRVNNFEDKTNVTMQEMNNNILLIMYSLKIKK